MMNLLLGLLPLAALSLLVLRGHENDAWQPAAGDLMRGQLLALVATAAVSAWWSYIPPEQALRVLPGPDAAGAPLLKTQFLNHFLPLAWIALYAVTLIAFPVLRVLVRRDTASVLNTTSLFLPAAFFPAAYVILDNPHFTLWGVIELFIQCGLSQSLIVAAFCRGLGRPWR